MRQNKFSGEPLAMKSDINNKGHLLAQAYLRMGKNNKQTCSNRGYNLGMQSLNWLPAEYHLEKILKNCHLSGG